MNSNEKYIFCYFEKRGRPLSTWNRSSSLICKKKSASYITNIKDMRKESKLKKLSNGWFNDYGRIFYRRRWL